MSGAESILSQRTPAERLKARAQGLEAQAGSYVDHHEAHPGELVAAVYELASVTAEAAAELLEAVDQLREDLPSAGIAGRGC
ncbi:MAG: hypothetical protein ACYTAN_01715 [Planctomycetota bacterium]